MYLSLLPLYLAFSLRPRCQPHPLQSQTGGLLNPLGSWGEAMVVGRVLAFGAVQELSLTP